MFYIGKVITIFLHPITWAVLFFIYAVNRKKAIPKIYYYILGIFLFLASNRVFINQLGRSLENPVESNANAIFPTAVVLGGYCSWDADRETIVFFEAADRLFKAMHLYQTGQIKQIVLSGGTVFKSEARRSEALIARDYLVEMGIPDKAIYVEGNSRNTYQNALETAKILHSKNINNITLITSASHMSRSFRCFKKQGFIIFPYATDYHTVKPGSFVWFDYFVPSTKAMVQFDAFVKEWVGILAYKLMGKI